MILKKKHKYNMLDFLFIPFRISPITVSFIVLVRITNSLIPSLQVLITTAFINTALSIFRGGSTVADIYTPIVLMGVVILYRHLSGILLDLVTMRFKVKYEAEIIAEFTMHRAALQYRYIESDSHWNLVYRVSNDAGNTWFDGFHTLWEAIGLIIQVSSILVIIFMQVWWIPFVIIAFSIPLFHLSIKSGNAQYDAYKRATEYKRKAQYLHDVLTKRDNYEERSLFNYTNHVNQKWHDQFEAARKISIQARAWAFIRMKLSGMVVLLISLLITAIMIIPVYQGNVSIGIFIALINATFGLVQMMSWTIGGIMQNLASKKEYLKELTAFMGLDTQPEAMALPSAAVQGSVVPLIEFKHVFFKYPYTDQYILKDFTVTFEPHKHYSLVGKNGAGKSTVTKLLLGLYDNYEGDIYIGQKTYVRTR